MAGTQTVKVTDLKGREIGSIKVSDYDPRQHKVLPDSEYPNECIRRDIEWLWDRMNTLFMDIDSLNRPSVKG